MKALSLFLGVVCTGIPPAAEPVAQTIPAAATAASVAQTAESGTDATAIYTALRDIGFDPGAALRVENVEFTRGPATFVLTRGTWIPLEPVGGRVTGAVFLGDGRVRYEPPTGVERDQLEKFTDEQTLDEEFSEIYMRFTDTTVERVAANVGNVTETTPTDTNVVVQAADRRSLEAAEELHAEVREYFLDGSSNLEARVLVDLVDQRDGLFVAWIDTRDDGPLYFSQNPMGDDLYRLSGFSARADGFDVWGGFGAPEDPGARPIHYDLQVALRGDDVEEARAELSLQPASMRRTLVFDAHPLLEMREVLDDGGNPLVFFREHVDGARSESKLTVVFPEPLPTDRPTQLTFVYGGDIVDTLWGGGEYAIKVPDDWFPSIGYLQRATFDLAFRVDKTDKVYASGVRVSDEVEGDERVVRFKQELPVAMVSFNYGSMSERVIDVEGAPPVVVFGESSGIGGDMLRNVGVDVGNSLVMFGELFGDYPFPYMSATRIPYAHGQGFPGLLHLAAGSFQREVPGHTEAFRGHETAHQWWGHIVGWKTYRDQWISEGFAEYSGALYAAAYLDEPEILDEMTEAWRNDVFKRGNVGFRRFGMAPGTVQRRSDGTWSGPITLGQRLSSSLTPADYAMLAYEKGAYVLHMLRMLMYDWPTGSDEPFRDMMRDFVATHAGGAASNESFRAVVEKHFGGDMGWFFDQWVHGTAVPTYRYAWKTKTAIDGHRTLELRVRQSVVPDVPFRMFVPVRVELGDDRFVVLKVLVDEPVEYYSFDLPPGLAPEDVIFNPKNAVLADVDKEDW